MDWKYIVTTAIALLALGISWATRRDTKSAAVKMYEQQIRLEQYEHHPLVQVAVLPDGDRIKVKLTNSSHKNAVSSYKIKLILRVHVDRGKLSLEEESYALSGGILLPNTSIEVGPNEINEHILHVLPILRKFSSDQYNFVVRAIVECVPPHPKAPPFIEDGHNFFVYEEGGLRVKSSVSAHEGVL